MKSFAFVFPGQGSQAVGMLDAWGDHPAVLETVREASDALGEDVGRLIRERPREALAWTTNPQPVHLQPRHRHLRRVDHLPHQPLIQLLARYFGPIHAIHRG